MVRKIVISLMSLFIISAFATGAMAQQGPATTPAPAQAQAPASTTTTPSAKMGKVRGVVTRVDQATKEVVVKGKKHEVTFATNDQTKITQGNRDLNFSDLKTNEHVIVRYSKENGQRVAHSIHVSTKHAATKKQG